MCVKKLSVIIININARVINFTIMKVSMDACFVCNNKLTDKKCQYEKQKLVLLDCNLNKALQSLLVELDGTRLSLEFEKQVICRKCKGSLSNYQKAKVTIVERLEKGSKGRSSTSPHTPLTTGAKRSGLVSEGGVAPKRLRYITEDEKHSPSVTVR